MSKVKLLVADDSLTIQKVIRLALSHDEYEIQAVSDGNDAIQQVLLFKPKVVLIDVTLPGKSAFEVKKEVNELAGGNQICFVLMSSAFEKVDENKVSGVGFHGRLTKPFDPAQLRDVLSRVIAELKTTEIEIPITQETERTKVEPMVTQEISIQLDESWDKEDPFLGLAPPPFSKDRPEEFQWNIRDHQVPSGRSAAFRDIEPTLAPPEGLSDLENVTFKLDRPPLESSEFVEQTNTPSTINSFSSEQIENLIKRELQESVERSIQKILPEIAERVIKQEIHRMLQEEPQQN